MYKAGSQIKEIIAEYTQTLKTSGVNVERVILYGSYAKANERKDSDIDLVVISKDFRKMNPVRNKNYSRYNKISNGVNLRERLEVLGIAAARIMKPVEVKGYTPEEIETTQEASFLKEVLDVGVSI